MTGALAASSRRRRGGAGKVGIASHEKGEEADGPLSRDDASRKRRREKGRRGGRGEVVA